MKLVKGKSKERKKKGSLTSGEKFNRAWRRVQNQQKKNESFREDVERFVSEVEGQIEESERRYAEALYASTERLIGFYRRKSLLLWQRETLLDWLLENLMALTSSPFSDHLDLVALQKQCEDALEAMHPMGEAFADDPLEEAPADGEAATEDEQRSADIFEDLFADFDLDDDEENPFTVEEDDDWGDDPFEDFFRGQREYEEARKQKARSLSQMLKGSSVNRLFRRLARALHPDLERDDAAREHKNHLMSELIEARNNSDIPKIFALYSEHVGDSPLAELDGDLDTATQLLEEQYRALRDGQDELLAEHPRRAMIYQRFHHKNRREVRRAIADHLASLDALIANEQELVAEVTSLKKLKPFLEDRHTAGIMNELDFRFGFFE